MYLELHRADVRPHGCATPVTRLLISANAQGYKGLCALLLTSIQSPAPALHTHSHNAHTTMPAPQTAHQTGYESKASFAHV